MFIKVKNRDNKVLLLNVRHIISIAPHTIKNYKLGEPDTICTKIEYLGAMVSSALVDESISEIEKLIKESLTK